MIIQLTVLVSSIALELITKDVPLTIDAAGADKKPCVPPGVLQVRKIVLPVATAVVDTVTVPATRVAVPMLALLPVAIFNLFPAVVSEIFPATDSFSAGDVVPMPTFPLCLISIAVPWSQLPTRKRVESGIVIPPLAVLRARNSNALPVESFAL